MECYPNPIDDHQNPYPDHSVDVTDVKFKSDLVLLRTKEGLANRDRDQDLYVLAAPFTITWDRAVGKGGSITVPAGFITDLTSVPPLFRLFVSRAGPWLEAAVVHDYLYIAWQLEPGRKARDVDQKFSDDVMFAAMRTANVRWWRRWCIYLALRAFGSFTFRNTRNCHTYFANGLDPRLRYLAELPQNDSGTVV